MAGFLRRSCMMIAAVQLWGAGSSGSAQIGPRQMRPSPRTQQSVQARAQAPLTEKEVQSVLDILEAQKEGDVQRVSESMRTARMDVQGLERRLARMIYAVVDARMRRAEDQLRKTKESSYLDPALGVVIQRDDLKDWQERLSRQTEVEYRSAGGLAQFKKDKAVVLKYEVAIARQLAPLYQMSREGAERKEE